MKELEPRHRTHIRNFHEVTPWLFRGGQPTAEGFVELKQLGVRTVVSFRWGQKVIAAEKAACESVGLEFISMPLNYWNLPTQQVVEKFLALLDDESKRPFFVHCLHGADRTGFLVAVYRMAKENWGLEPAYKEMKERGFHRIRIRHFKWYLWNYARRAQIHLGNIYRWL